MTIGSRGDIEPFVWLARALNKTGYEVTLCAPFKPDYFPDANGIGFFSLLSEESEFNPKGDPRRRSDSRPTWQDRSARKRFGVEVLAGLARVAEEPADVVIHHAGLPGNQIAELLDVPHIAVCFDPCWIPTESFPSALCPIWLPSSLNRMSYFRSKPNVVIRQIVGNTVEWRQQVLGLKDRKGCEDPMLRADGSPATVINAFSEQMFNNSLLRYPEGVHTTGFWFPEYDENRKLDKGIFEFTNTAESTVYVGFGSIGETKYHNQRALSKALEKSGVRAVVGSAIDGAGKFAGNSIFVADDVPFDLLFPRVDGVVHHGGIGTLAAALAAGKPQAIHPIGPKNSKLVSKFRFNSWQMHLNGVAPKPIMNRKKFTESLAESIAEIVWSPERCKRAQEISKEIRREDGIKATVGIVNGLLRSGSS